MDWSIVSFQNGNDANKSHRDEKLLEKYGLKANDAILAEEKHAGLYEDLLQNYNAKLIAGGAAQNTARGAQVCLIHLLVIYHVNHSNSTSSHQTLLYILAVLEKTSTQIPSPRRARPPVCAQNTSMMPPSLPVDVVSLSQATTAPCAPISLPQTPTNWNT
jgi:hypothetical protein